MKKLIFLLLTLLVSASCTKKIYVPVETRSVSTDTVERFVTLRERLATVDSVTTESRGDTVFRTIVRERWRNLSLADSSRHASVDTVRIKRNVILSDKNVEKKRFRTGCILGAALMILLFILITIVRRGIFRNIFGK